MSCLKLLYDYFPTAVDTGRSLVFISEDWRIELTEHKNANFCSAGRSPAIIRVRLFKKALNGDFIPGHYEDFQHDNLGKLAGEIEQYVQNAVGSNLREHIIDD